MGGRYALLCAEKFSFDGLILIVPFLGHYSALIENIRPLINFLACICPCLKYRTFNKGHNDAECGSLTHFYADPLDMGGAISLKSMQEFDRGIDYIRQEKPHLNYNGKVLFIVAGDDKVISNVVAQQYFDEMTCQKKYIEYSGALHMI